MDCARCRDLISAQLDGDETPDEAELIDWHTARCAVCRQWLDDAALITRLARTASVEPGPDVTDAVLGRMPPRAIRVPGRLLRLTLGALGVVQLVLGVRPLLVSGSGSHHEGSDMLMLGAHTAHFVHESAAWNLALGVAFVWMALRVRHVAGLVPVLTAFVVVLFGVSALDLGAGAVRESRVTSHVPVLLGLICVILLARRPPGREHEPPDGLPLGAERTDHPAESRRYGVHPSRRDGHHAA